MSPKITAMEGIFCHFPSSPRLRGREAGSLRIVPSRGKPGGGWGGSSARSPSRFLPGEGELGELRHRQNIKVRAISDTGKEPLQHQHEPGEQGAAQGHGTKELLLATRALERLGFKGASPARVTPKCEERAAFACLLLEAFPGFAVLFLLSYH